MKIAVLGPVSWRTPPRHYGPWETVAYNLTEGLVERGFDVTLFATGDSYTSGKLRWICPRPYSEDKFLDPKVWECLHISEVFERADEFDLIHNNYDFLPLTYSKLVSTPILTTIHGFSSPKIYPVYLKYKDSNFVSISYADRIDELNYLATVYNGIKMDEFTFQEKQGDYLIFLGRISFEKGTHLAVELAQKTGMKLIIAGIIQEEDYFNQMVKPYIDGKQIEFIGPVEPKDRNELLGKGYALLHLITLPERFGLTMAESMACGTPVIGMDLGSVIEVISHNKTGFLVNSIEESVQAVEKISSINRRDCRKRVEENFTVDHMTEEYIKVYKKILIPL
ncbi:MAG: glycosyltransferase family 4 protein [Actinobacteria bacterium]|nr:glycosyltransferase family 4 protein [Actinomycetota bacterium]